ncbi:MAG: hypothetical protein AB7V27_13670 [Candidatus Binatia bacterium]
MTGPQKKTLMDGLLEELIIAEMLSAGRRKPTMKKKRRGYTHHGRREGR